MNHDSTIRNILASSVLAVAALIGTSSAYAAGGFEYSGDTGPGFWSEIAGAEACEGSSADARQSPINIRNAIRKNSLKAPLLTAYEAEVELINNGHTIEQEYHNGTVLTLDDVDYELLQFHFHTQSEHTVRGRQSDMELHAVFKNMATGNLLVVGKMFKRGQHSDFLDVLIDAGLPQKAGDHSSSDEEIDIEAVLGDTSKYFTYSGSLTTPPCSEIVTWIVLKEKATMSKRQYEAFNGIMGNNFRPVQARKGRQVYSTRPGGADED